MVLAFDIGNTHTFLGGFSGKKILFTDLISTSISLPFFHDLGVYDSFADCTQGS